MDDRDIAYEVILRRHDVAEYITKNLSAVQHVFASLDFLAAAIAPHDAEWTEVINSLADLLRGTLAERHGVDISPTSCLGPSEPIDLEHTMRVLGRIVGEDTARGNSVKAFAERDRHDLYERVVELEQELLAVEAALCTSPSDRHVVIFDRVKRNVASLRMSHVLQPSTADNDEQRGRDPNA